jgi:hypothetical protein
VITVIRELARLAGLLHTALLWFGLAAKLTQCSIAKPASRFPHSHATLALWVLVRSRCRRSGVCILNILASLCRRYYSRPPLPLPQNSN